ncbi:LytTR family transcriptional regulator DNA-binding domain-containing protein [Maribacter litopenaei]|uniref:LytTR family transcriptional regulator DNA-binding domain-containing protein n=1 Tax=Maribacter litopenaei TaxID=2976127 RepID=UPI003B845742
MKDGTVVNAFKTLKTFEKQLPQNFIRIHQSYIVNTNYVSESTLARISAHLKKEKKTSLSQNPIRTRWIN